MRFLELKTAVLSIINKDDPHKATKEFHLKNWCRAFWLFFDKSDEHYLPFFLDVLCDPGCWINTDAVHPIQLNRRKVALKMIELQSWSGKTNPLDGIDRYRIACWCCLEENLILSIENFKFQHKIKYVCLSDMKKLVNSLKACTWSDRLTEYWMYLIGGYASELGLKGRHVYEYGLSISVNMYEECDDKFIGYVEAVEFFWHKIKLLPEETLTAQRKAEIFVKTTLCATESNCSNHPEILEFCISQICIDNYPELMKRDLIESGIFSTLDVLRLKRRFDLIQILFDSLVPKDVLEDNYHKLLKMLMSFDVKDHSKFYVDRAVKLFMHIWMKVGFDSHRSTVIGNEMHGSGEGGTLLESLVMKNYMDPVWIMLDQACNYEKEIFLSTRQARNMCRIFRERGDKDSVMKLLLSPYFVCVQDPKPL